MLLLKGLVVTPPTLPHGCPPWALPQVDMRTAQFSEDAGPLAHPIRPDSYVKMDNFYTVGGRGLGFLWF